MRHVRGRRGDARPARARRAATAGGLAVTLAATVVACGDGGTDGATTAGGATLPPGEAVVLPFQNRPDAAVGRFQLKVVNGGDERLHVRTVQLVWEGATTDVVPRDDVVLPGQRVDLPVAIPTAACAGDGTAADMPDIADAVAVVGLEGGSERELPVVDARGVLRRLYEEDCERQLLEAAAGLSWADLRAGELDGRPVTEGVLRVTRRAATDDITIHDIRGTVIFDVEPLAPGTPLAVLAAGDDVVDLPVRFVEARCDAHAQSEASQPVNFLVDLDLGEGVDRTVLVLPTHAERDAMRERLAAGCEALGELEVLGGG